MISRCTLPLWLSCVLLVGSFSLRAQDSNTPVNLAVVATPASSYVSGDTTLMAINDGIAPRNSRDNRRGSYGNWPHTGTEWVQYEWSQPISTAQVEVYWWMDGRGVGAPKSCRLLYWNGKAFVPVAKAAGLCVEGNKFNPTTFAEVKTTKLRLEMDSDVKGSVLPLT